MSARSTRIKKDPRQRILDAAIRLFSQKGFAAVGVREIAREAGVNISMISYYYEGKVGILKAIMETFFQGYVQVFDIPDAEQKDPDACAHEIFGNIVRFVRRNLELSLVAYNELPLEVPEIAQLKADWIMRMIKRAAWILERFGLDPSDRIKVGVVGPTLFSMIMMHFRIRHIQQEVFGLRFDDAYYELFTRMGVTLFLEGIHGLASQTSSKGWTHD
jgi:AcrR family transcriptional regulator